MANKQKKKGRIPRMLNRLGLILAGLFYLVSVFYVMYNSEETRLLNSEEVTITFAHWNLEDGFREGFDEAIRLFQELKAKEGKKVRIIQTTVPTRGYRQWFLTQMIGGSPADVMKYSASSEMLNRYFTPLSQYVSRPNPFNKGTVMESVPWKDTFVDGMQGSLDSVYSEYFGVGTYFHTTRLFVNMDLLEKATGSRKLPEDLQEWLEICQKMRGYGKKVGKPIIPIGVRGFDKATINYLFCYYYSQLNSDLNDTLPEDCSAEATQADILEAMIAGDVEQERLFAAVEIIKELGQYFCEGFSAVDLEQTKFLFFSGKVGFFPEGTFNAFSMVNNSPFEVEVTTIPVIGHTHKYSRYFTGRLSEMGVTVGGAFGIPKATKHFDVSLEFLQFITSYDINQLIMSYCKWPPAVKNAKYEGLMKKMQPVKGKGRVGLPTPFLFKYRGKSGRKMVEDLETMIVEKTDNSVDFFRTRWIARKDILISEITESLLQAERNKCALEKRRSNMNIGAMRDNSTESQQKRDQYKNIMNFENYVTQVKNTYNLKRFKKALGKLK
jgi:raffinose/stachyose/melibiose transport system substrate-binding protein